MTMIYYFQKLYSNTATKSRSKQNLFLKCFNNFNNFTRPSDQLTDLMIGKQICYLKFPTHHEMNSVFTGLKKNQGLGLGGRA